MCQVRNKFNCLFDFKNDTQQNKCRETPPHMQTSCTRPCPDCQYSHPLTMTLYNQTGSTCWKPSSRSTDCQMRSQAKQKHTEMQSCKVSLALTWTRTRRRSMSVWASKCFIRSLHLPPLLHPQGDNDPLPPPSSLLPPPPCLSSLHLACVEVREHVRLRGCGPCLYRRQQTCRATN